MNITKKETLNHLCITKTPVSANQSMLMKLYHYSQKLATQSVSSPVMDKKCQELNKFRKKLEEEKQTPHHNPIEYGRKTAIFYRSIFLGISVLFFCLFLLVHFQNISWSYHFLFEGFGSPKLILSGICVILSIVTFGIFHSIRPEKEASSQLVNRTKRKLKRIYYKQSAQLGLKEAISFSLHYKKTKALKHAFYEASEIIQDHQEKALRLMGQIKKSSAKNKRDLFNSALIELNDELHKVLQDFKRKLVQIVGV